MSFLSSILDLFVSDRPAAGGNTTTAVLEHPEQHSQRQLHADAPPEPDGPDLTAVLQRIRGIREPLATDYQTNSSDLELLSKAETRLQEGAFDLPMLPSANLAVMDALANPNQEMAEIADLIEGNPVLTAEVLKTANSAFYSRGQEIADVRGAVTRIGFRQLRLLMLTLSARAVILQGKEILPLAQRLWEHSIACAVFCRHLAKLTGEDPEDMFTGGLLHDVGKIIVLNTIREVHKDMEEYVPPACVLGLLFDGHHQIIGADVVRNWSLPAKIADVAGHHHSPLGARHTQAAALATLANRMCRLQSPTDNPYTQETPEVLAASGLSEEARESIARSIPEILAEIAERLT